MSLVVSNLAVEFGGKALFANVDYQIKPQDKIGLVGKNGAGKSTMLKILSKEQLPTAGSVNVSKGYHIGYLPQHLECDDKHDVITETKRCFEHIYQIEDEIHQISEELEARSDYESDDYHKLIDKLTLLGEQLAMYETHKLDAEAESVLKGLGFTSDDFTRATSELSGGWRMRIELAKILLQKPDLLLLDEPTNHLDIESIQWLELLLKRYKGAVILISHDRAFLDAVTNRTIEIYTGKIFDFKVNYSQYLIQRQEQRDIQQAAFANQQKQIEQTEKFIDRFRSKASKATQVQSRIKQLERMDKIEIDQEDTSKLNLKFDIVRPSGKVVYDIEGVSAGYAANSPILTDVNLHIERGQNYAFLGKNGQGKSTLAKAILGELPHVTGKLDKGYEVHIGYFAQNQADLLDPDLSVFDSIDEIATGEIRTKIRDILGAFMFSGDAIDKKVKFLSGGEKTRLAMIKLLLEPHNVLVLDEPTNHLDLSTKEVLKQALLNYDGTIIIVSHDRYFLEGLPDKVIEFSDGKVKEHLGGLADFLEAKSIDSLKVLEQSNPEKKEAKSKSKKPRTDDDVLNKMEQKIDKLESKLTKIKAIMLENPTEENHAEMESISQQLDECMLEWMELNGEA